MREIKFCFEIFKETFRVAGAKHGQEGRAERSRRQGGSSHNLVSLPHKGVCILSCGRRGCGKILVSRQLNAQIDFEKCDACEVGRTRGGETERRLKTHEA